MNDPGSAGARRHVFLTALENALGHLDLRLESKQYERLWNHFDRLVEANRSFNLTRITDPAEAAIKHYADSLSLLARDILENDQPLKLLDVGTGAGFPAVPLAVVRPAWSITAIDGTGKKARFVAETAAHLGLTNLRAEQARASEWSRTRAGSFDAICLRAVATLEKGIAEVHSLVCRGGRVIFYKSAEMTAEEIAAGNRAARRGGLSAGLCYPLTIPGPKENLQRLLMVYRKRPGRREPQHVGR